MSAESLELGSLLPPDSSTVDEDYSAKIERHLKRLFLLADWYDWCCRALSRASMWETDA